MTFAVTYRGADGALREESVEAADRAACVAALKARGIAPTRVVAGEGARPGKAEGRGRLWLRLGIPAVLAILGVLAYLAFAPREEARPAEGPRPVRPAEKPKAAPPKAPAAPAATNAPAASANSPAARREETYVDERGIERYPGGMRVRRPAARTVKIEIDPKHRFKHTSEAQIAGLLEVKPGSLIVGDMKYSYRFVEDFKESLNEPIEILDTDSEYDKQLKRDVIESKKQLKAAMDRGEDIAQIMTDTRNELRRLGQYRENLMQELRKIRADDSYTDKDIEDFTTAANKMLEEKGCRPIKIPTLLIRYIREKQAQAQQNQQEEH